MSRKYPEKANSAPNCTDLLESCTIGSRFNTAYLVYYNSSQLSFRTYVIEVFYKRAPCTHVNFCSLEFINLLSDCPFPGHQFDTEISPSQFSEFSVSHFKLNDF